jgi:glycosyltransferase involved in cell wall biosynthesis
VEILLPRQEAQGRSHKGTGMAPSPALSAVICTYNRHEQLAGALESLRAQAEPCEIIVVDNSSDRTAAEAFAGRYQGQSQVRYVVESVPGLSRARNIGTALSSGEIVAFIDDDAVAPPHWAQRIVEPFQDVAVGAVGGRIVPRWSMPKPDWLTGRLLGFLGIVDWGSEVREIRNREWIAGCNMAFRKSVLSSIGFSENLGRNGDGGHLLSNEEMKVVDLIRGEGLKIVYTPHAEVEHVIDPDRMNEEWFYKRVAWQAVSDLISRERQTGKPAKYQRDAVELHGFGVGGDIKKRIDAIYDVVTCCLAGDSKFSDRPGGSEPKSRMAENLKVIPAKIAWKMFAQR